MRRWSITTKAIRRSQWLHDLGLRKRHRCVRIFRNAHAYCTDVARVQTVQWTGAPEPLRAPSYTIALTWVTARKCAPVECISANRRSDRCAPWRICSKEIASTFRHCWYRGTWFEDVRMWIAGKRYIPQQKSPRKDKSVGCPPGDGNSLGVAEHFPWPVGWAQTGYPKVP